MAIKANHGGNLRRQFLDKQLITTGADSTGLTPKQKSNVKKWTTRYRRNWDLFVEEVLGIKLYLIQKIMIHMMGISDLFFAIATRGTAKSFLVGIGAICELCLKSYSEIVITSSTIPQAAKLVEKKIRDEIIKKLSPYLLYMYQHEYIVITKSTTSDGGAYIVENKLNGSTITVLPCLDSSRGSRSTMNIYEECRLLKKSIIDSVFEPMGHCRPAKYLLKKEYQTKRWLEKARSIYITSARYKFEWFYRLFQETVTNYYISKHEVYIPFGEDIFAAINDGSRTWADYRKNKKSMNEMDFRMEILNEMVGESEDAFFNLESFKRNQVIKQCFRPPTLSQLYSDIETDNRQKKENEVRIIGVDFAFANTTSNQKNDNTIIYCVGLDWKKNKFKRKIEYIEGHEASDTLGAADRIRELFYDYNADYLVLDLRNGGEVLYNYLTIPKENSARGSNWNYHGLTVSEKTKYQVVPQAKIDDLIERTVDKEAIKCIIPMTGSPSLNSLMWAELKKQIETNSIEFLISMQDYQTILEDDGEYFQLTAEQLADKLVPYLQTDLMIQEAINLKAELRNDNIKLVEPKSGTKDRVVCLSYINYIASLIETEWNKQSQDEDFDIDNIQLIW